MPPCDYVRLLAYYNNSHYVNYLDLSCTTTDIFVSCGGLCILTSQESDAAPFSNVGCKKASVFWAGCINLRVILGKSGLGEK